jgi:hypothetical protein
MLFDPGIQLVLVVQVITLAVSIVLGGFRVGSLKRTIQMTLSKSDLDPFWTRLHQRLAELGFVAGRGEGQFVQGGPHRSGLATHAKTQKAFSVEFQETAPEQLTATLTLLYLDPILADTGESAYRDGLLNYVSGGTDRMVVVPNRSLLAMNSLIGGAIACLLAVITVFVLHGRFMPMIQTLSITEALVGVVALVFIVIKPKEITGRWIAVAGISMSMLAIGILAIGISVFP